MPQLRRVLHLIDRLDLYGAAPVIGQLAGQLSDDAWQLAVVALRADRRQSRTLESAGVACRNLDSRWNLDVIAWARLAHTLRRDSFHLLHLWDARLLPLIGRLLPQRTPLAVSLRGLPPPSTGQLRRVSRYFLTSERLRPPLLRRGVNAARLKVIPDGVHAQEAQAVDRAAVLTQVDFPGDARIIGTAGPLVRQENFAESIWRFELVRLLHPTARLVIVGEGPDRRLLERYARLVSSPECVRIISPGSVAASLLSVADVYWQAGSHPSSPQSLLSAMQRGLAVVAADTPSHRELIESESTGVLVPANSRAEFARATDELLIDAQRARRLGVAAASRARDSFPLAKMAGAYATAYDEIID